MASEAFKNVIVTDAAIDGSENVPIHVDAIAKYINVDSRSMTRTILGFIFHYLNMQPARECSYKISSFAQVDCPPSWQGYLMTVN